MVVSQYYFYILSYSKLPLHIFFALNYSDYLYQHTLISIFVIHTYVHTYWRSYIFQHYNRVQLGSPVYRELSIFNFTSPYITYDITHNYFQVQLFKRIFVRTRCVVLILNTACCNRGDKFSAGKQQ